MVNLSACLIDEPEGLVQASYIFAHGAGAPMDSDFMQSITALLIAQGVRVIRFEFPYMSERRQSGKRRPPNRQLDLLECFGQVVERVSERFIEPLFIGGKSMGGRMATLLLTESLQQLGCKGVICFGYPFHPQGKPEKLRTEHLFNMSVPTLVLQGTRDALGNCEEVEDYGLPKAIELHWLEDGDHDLKPRVKSGFKQFEHLQAAATKAGDFITDINS
tara:strand:+ start:4812 stop:5465 length:654 start_codon:yes stop_codon:yes gene_type:complete